MLSSEGPVISGPSPLSLTSILPSRLLLMPHPVLYLRHGLTGHYKSANHKGHEGNTKGNQGVYRPIVFSAPIFCPERAVLSICYPPGRA